MRRILIIQHETEAASCKGFALQLLIDRWRADGDEVIVAAGTRDLPDADLAFLHVDLSVVPQEYAEAARRYPRSVNAAALDIRKRTVSRNILTRDDPWPGPVIVKTDLNCNGVPEFVAEIRRLGRDPTPEEGAGKVFSYETARNPAAIPAAVWDAPQLVVERFLPERDKSGFYLRTWIFLGDRERCRRFRAAKPMIKGSDYLSVEPCPVPDFLRAERERLGFDYGKFDFVMQGDEPILLDANKTMGLPPANRPPLRAAYEELAAGLDALG